MLPRGKNPLGKHGIQTRCAVCCSINHWAQNCPDNPNLEHNTYVVNDIVLHQTDHENPQEFKHFMLERWSSALLDCGASKTVCGQEWLNEYINNLSEKEQQNIIFRSNNHVYRFGDGRKIRAMHSVTFPAVIDKEHINIQSNIINNDIPLPQTLMKKAKMKINFQNNTINVIGENIPLVITSGHYALPLTQAKQAINNINRD